LFSHSNLEDNCVVHGDAEVIIGDNVIIGHGAVIHDRAIGSNVLVGNNAIILDEDEIGDFCVIGAGTVVPPGIKIPRGSLAVGTPARVTGPLSFEKRAKLKDGTDLYRKLAQEYKRQGL
jgi:carbonic anhydrase/acetyltransferase-like protein (isoleucine patch superfamily)